MDVSKYLIVGGSAAGMAAAQVIHEHDPKGRVLVLSAEQDPPYFRPLIPFLISGKKRTEQIFIAGSGPYTSDAAEIRLKTKAAHLDTDGQQITSENNDTFSYDKLLIATGSRPYIPEEISGTEQKGVFALRTLQDAQETARRATDTTEALMLGGGLLNLKAAFALLERKIKVTLVVYSPEVLSQLMEPEDAILIRKALEDAGLNIITGVSAREIIGGANGVRGVLLDNGQELPCQMVCIGKGVRPYCDWLKDSGIRLQNGIVADRFTRTTVNNIFTAGDVAVTFDAITGEPMTTGLWTNAVEMGRCAGLNMVGRPTGYGGTFGILNATQVAKLPFVSMGIVHSRGKDLEIHRRESASGYRKLVFTENGQQLIGAVFIGDIAKAGLYRSLINNRTNVSRFKQQMLNGGMHYGQLLKAGKEISF